MYKSYSSAYNRYMSKRKALRKRRIAEALYQYPYYNNLHQYSKNKIHCSCSWCSTKTKNKGRRRYKKGNFNRSVNYKLSDLKKINAMENDKFEYENEVYYCG